MQHNFFDKSVLITGSSSGIGFAIATKFYLQGYQVIINGRDIKRLQTAAEKLPGAFPIPADAVNPVDAKKMVNTAIEKFDKLDVLVCNVGSGASVPPGSENFDEWGRVFDINFRSATNMIESAGSALAKTKGSIICISSICGCEVIDGAPLTYSAAKAALNAYVRGVARPLSRLGVRINAIAPGNILFPNSVWDLKLKKNAVEVNNFLKKNVPLNCFGSPDDVADLALYLASDKSKFATGSIWRIDGGQGNL